MNSWYAAHLVLYVKLKAEKQDSYPVWENIILIRAQSEAEAFEKAEQRGKEAEGDDGGTFRWGGKPAQWVFAGVRKLTECEDPEKRPGDGTEISYVQLQVDSELAVRKLVEGQQVAVKYAEPFAD